MKYWLVFLMVFPLTACSSFAPYQSNQPSQFDQVLDLPDFGEAPELASGVWLNTDVPLTLSDLRDQVVLLDMWTFG